MNKFLSKESLFPEDCGFAGGKNRQRKRFLHMGAEQTFKINMIVQDVAQDGQPDRH